MQTQRNKALKQLENCGAASHEADRLTGGTGILPWTQPLVALCGSQAQMELIKGEVSTCKPLAHAYQQT